MADRMLFCANSELATPLATVQKHVPHSWLQQLGESSQSRRIPQGFAAASISCMTKHMTLFAKDRRQPCYWQHGLEARCA